MRSSNNLIDVYPAGPNGFADASRWWHFNVFIPRLRKLMLTVHDPWTLTTNEEIMAVLNLRPGQVRNETLKKLRHKIGARNRDAILLSEAIIANLDASDSGTLSEVAFGAAKKMALFGLRTEPAHEESLTDPFLQYLIVRSGGAIGRSLDGLEELLAQYRLAGRHLNGKRFSAPEFRIPHGIGQPIAFFAGSSSETAKQFSQEHYIGTLASAGYTVVDQHDLRGPMFGPFVAAAIEQADIVVALLDGQEVMNAAVVGYAAGCGKPIVAIRSDVRQSGELLGPYNLQVAFFVDDSGGCTVSAPEQLLAVASNLKHFPAAA